MHFFRFLYRAFYFLLLLNFFSLSAYAQSFFPVSCSSSKDCSETTRGLLQVGTLLGAWLGPHLLFQRFHFQSSDGFTDLGWGPKWIHLGMQLTSASKKSYEDSHSEYFLTELNFQKMNSAEFTSTSLYRSFYKVGYGFKNTFNDVWQMTSSLQWDLIAYSNKSSLDSGPEFNTRFKYYYNDKIKPLIALSVMAHPLIDYVLSIGAQMNSIIISIHSLRESALRTHFSYIDIQFLWNK